jgi:hypothetical protein
MPKSTEETEQMMRNFSRNIRWLKSGPYMSKLSPDDERLFRGWLSIVKVPGFDPDVAMNDYDLRGFWRAWRRGDPLATSAVGPDGHIHYPDIWKTPYHETFSNESRYATRKAPKWTDDGRALIAEDGSVIWSLE